MRESPMARDCPPAQPDPRPEPAREERIVGNAVSMRAGSSGSAETARSSALTGRGQELAARLRRLLHARDEARTHRALRWLGPLLEREWLWHLNRKAVASGAALGVFIGLLIPVGQIPVAAAGALLLRANLPAAALGTLVSNPLTVGPIYWLAYHTGEAILAPAGPTQDPPAAGAHEGRSPSSSEWLDRIADMGEPLMLGLAVFAVGGALLAYLAVRLAWRANVAWRRRRNRGAHALPQVRRRSHPLRVGSPGLDARGD